MLLVRPAGQVVLEGGDLVVVDPLLLASSDFKKRWNSFQVAFYQAVILVCWRSQGVFPSRCSPCATYRLGVVAEMHDTFIKNVVSTERTEV